MAISVTKGKDREQFLLDLPIQQSAYRRLAAEAIPLPSADR
jgi:hypothetical protein